MVKWIPVSEKLPEEYGEYLITWKNSKYPKTYIGICECEITDVYDHEHNRFEVEWLFDGYITTAYPDSYVIAWMPLPKPYEPQESEETETWNGIHAQITAPNGTFKKIFEDAGK